MPKKPVEKLFVYCFQPGLGAEPPFLAEVVELTAHKATLKFKGKKIVAHRAACSTSPYTQTDLDKYGQAYEAHAKLAAASRPPNGDQSVARPPKGSITGFF